MSGSDVAVAAIVDFLERDGGLVVRRDGDTLHVSSPNGLFAFAPVVHLPADLLVRYLDEAEAPPWGGDPRAEALSLLQINIMEELDTDHGNGRNYTRSVGLRQGSDGRVALVVDQDRPDVPHVPPNPDLRWTAERPDDRTR